MPVLPPDMAPLLNISRLETTVLCVRDLDRSLSWYECILGLEKVHQDDIKGVAIMHLEGAPLTLCRVPNYRSTSTAPSDRLEISSSLSSHLISSPIFAVADAKAARDALTEAGFSVTPIQNDLAVRWCAFSDPDGNRLEVCQCIG